MPVTVRDGNVEKILQEATGVTAVQVEKASQPGPLGLWDAYALAVERTERLASKIEAVEQARSLSRQALGAYLPNASLQASKAFQGPEGTDPDAKVFIRGVQPILTGLNEVAALKGAGAFVRQREAELRHESGRLLLEVARSYYGLLMSRELLKGEQSIQELASKTLAKQKDYRARGRIRSSDVLSSEAQLAKSEAELTSLEDQMQQARESFAFLTGLPEGRDLYLDTQETFPDPSGHLEEMVKKSEQRWDVKAARESVAVAKATSLSAVGGFAPSLSLQGDYFLRRDEGAGDPRWTATMNASIPLFAGGRTVARVREAKSKVRQAELALSQTLRAARTEVRQALVAYRNSVRQESSYRKALEAVERSHKAQEEDNRLHLTTSIQYLQSLKDLEEARLNAVRARYQWRIQRVWLGVATLEWPAASTSPAADAPGVMP